MNNIPTCCETISYNETKLLSVVQCNTLNERGKTIDTFDYTLEEVIHVSDVSFLINLCG